MAGNPQEPNTHGHQKPVIIIHRLASYESFFNDHLIATYTLLDPLTAVGPDPAAVRTFLRQHGAGARALLCVEPTPLRKDILDCLPDLECVVGSTAGTDHIDLPECCRRGISVTNVGEAFSDDAADYAVGLLLDVLRKVSVGEQFVRAGCWSGHREFPLGVKLSGKRVGIVGLGSIGHRVAKRLVPFDCSIAYTSRTKKPSLPFAYHENVSDLALDSDILILCCSLTDATRDMINRDVFTALGREGVVINVGRGALIKEHELVQFLTEGKIAGAGLDVFVDEPNVPSQLLRLNNVVLSAHQAVCTRASFNAVTDIVVTNLDAFFSDKPLLTPIRLEKKKNVSAN